MMPQISILLFLYSGFLISGFFSIIHISATCFENGSFERCPLKHFHLLDACNHLVKNSESKSEMCVDHVWHKSCYNFHIKRHDDANANWYKGVNNVSINMARCMWVGGGWGKGIICRHSSSTPHARQSAFLQMLGRYDEVELQISGLLEMSIFVMFIRGLFVQLSR